MIEKPLKKIILCNILNAPIPEERTFKGLYKGRGDYYDEWSYCKRCSSLIHKDNHFLGDGIWRHEKG